jgi:hypothetical protein
LPSQIIIIPSQTSLIPPHFRIRSSFHHTIHHNPNPNSPVTIHTVFIMPFVLVRFIQKAIQEQAHDNRFQPVNLPSLAGNSAAALTMTMGPVIKAYHTNSGHAARPGVPQLPITAIKVKISATWKGVRGLVGETYAHTSLRSSLDEASVSSVLNLIAKRG